MTDPQNERTPAGGPGSGNLHAGNASGTQDTPPATDLEQTRRFLETLDRPGAEFRFRVIDPKDILKPHNFDGTLEWVAPALLAANAQGYGVFVVVNAGGHKAKQINRVRAVFADVDDPRAFKAKLEAEPLITHIEGRHPHLAVESSPGKLHIYWKVDDLPCDEFERIQKAIAARLSSDASVHDLPRLMRLPGFLHTKGNPFLTKLIFAHPDRPAFAADDVRRRFLATASASVAPPSSGVFGTLSATATFDTQLDSPLVVTKERHVDLLGLSGRLARQVRFEGLARESALAALKAERERGRWTREVTDSEMQRALDDGIEKCRTGEWKALAVSDAHDAAPALQEQPRLLRVDITDLRDAAAPGTEYVFDPIVPKGVTTLLGGHGGTGKSLLTLTMAAHAACGRDWAGFAVSGPSACAFVSLEDPAPVVRFRLKTIARHFDMDFDMLSRNLRVFDGTDMDAALVTEVNDHGDRKLRPTPYLNEVSELVAGAAFVVIDNASDAYDGDENNRRQVRFFIRLLTRLARQNNAGLVLLAHIDKAAAIHGGRDNNYSGSTHWNNGPRSRLALTSRAGGEDDDPTETAKVWMTHEKANLGPKAPPTPFRWAPTWDGAAVLVHENANDRAPEAALQANREKVAADADAIVAVLRMAADSEIDIPTALSGPKTAMHVLESFPELPAIYRSKPGRKRVAAALNQLVRTRRVSVAEIKVGSRNKKSVYRMAPQTPPTD